VVSFCFFSFFLGIVFSFDFFYRLPAQ
jgi:hypothetical protein